MKRIIKWFTTRKPKQATFNCPTCGRYYKFKTFKESHIDKSIFCKCNEILRVYINNNKVTNITIF